MFDTEIEKELFWQVIRELTFTPVITLPVLCESLSENTLGREIYDALRMDKTSTEYTNEFKRLQRLFRLLVRDLGTKKLKPSELITMSKIYDDVLCTKRRSLYNHMANQLKFDCIREDAPTVKKLKMAAKIDNINDDLKEIDAIAKFYPHYYAGERNGFDYIEYILLMNISITTHHRTLGLFERLLKEPNQKNIEQWIQKVSDSMRSSSAYMSYIDTFFSIFYYITAKKYNQNIAIMKDDLSYEKDGAIYDLAYCTSDPRADASNNQPIVIEMLTKTLPTAWRLINIENENNTDILYDKRQVEYMDSDIRAKALKYTKIIQSFVNRATEEAESILPTMFV